MDYSEKIDRIKARMIKLNRDWAKAEDYVVAYHHLRNDPKIAQNVARANAVMNKISDQTSKLSKQLDKLRLANPKKSEYERLMAPVYQQHLDYSDSILKGSPKAAAASVKADAVKLVKRVNKAVAGSAPPTKAEVAAVKEAARDVSAEAAEIMRGIQAYRDARKAAPRRKRASDKAPCKEGKIRGLTGRCHYPDNAGRTKVRRFAATRSRPCPEGKVRSVSTGRCQSERYAAKRRALGYIG